MASVKKASVLVAASVGAVEALKDQAGLCRWNYALRSLQQHAKSNMRSLSQTVRMSSAVSDGRSSERAKQSEESLRKVILIENVERVMASVKKASIWVAASVGAVEALKDQAGLCRWNYALRSLQQHAKSNMRSLSQAVRMSSAVSDGRSSERAKQSEESLRKVMYLSCWGPN
ncbi:hypothetical protein ZIOFF_068888 [Zingiber officinale]|uniref:Wound-responsive family protein n=2 Tax=Zingiber officinale TaxID=94328 RepID=A0A8J5CVH3_ZINOF|nr:hypothetical protein ZIOFF_068888 [Zingiber officinale]